MRVGLNSCGENKMFSLGGAYDPRGVSESLEAEL